MSLLVVKPGRRSQAPSLAVPTLIAARHLQAAAVTWRAQSVGTATGSWSEPEAQHWESIGFEEAVMEERKTERRFAES